MRPAHVTGRLIIIASLAGASLAAACRAGDDTALVAERLRSAVAADAPAETRAGVWAATREFYVQRNYQPAWIPRSLAGTQLTRAAGALEVVRGAAAHALDPDSYGAARLATDIAALQQPADANAARLERFAALELQITKSLLALGHDVAVGDASTPAAIDRRWKPRRTLPDLVQSLSMAADGDLDGWIESVRPRHPEYAALQQALANLLAERDQGDWPVVPAGDLRPGRSDPAAPVLRRRLARSGHLDDGAAASESSIYSENDAAAVRAFQDLHGLKSTGIVDTATLAAINVPLDERIRQVAMNLERWRWMPDDFGDRHLLINIPYFHLMAREHGKTVMDIRVVVGTPANKTPIFSSNMNTVVFSPYWHIPDSIVQGETVPAVVRDPSYLQRNAIDVLDLSKRPATPVDPASVDWDDAGQLERLAFRQRPGPANALGHVKFLFPNPYDVYLHDTPADRLFARAGRAFSHGCIRVEEPEALARYVLRGYAEWDDARIVAAMHEGTETHVALHEPIPVHVVYFTAWVDERGGLHFQPDVYGYDRAQSRTSSTSRPSKQPS
jgi:murein L,D-transpeptidase YcbB/YkuD